ncbi:MAG: TraB/GumN family protein [Phenylobacterium sp.]|uniref:TraB/GumN family protein n=1 Tax=Phenylobacterium sp. TaxID=1871053 RepID=UPI001A3639F7|nr:TraB/GumN family protein [Phenylobacterium sp.]MBL8771394.1 TraB/GumN family protein [Phenylobacterium sp.]
MIRTLSRLARRALAPVVACGLLAATPAAAEPALWVIKDEDSTIYLMGTVHVLRPGTAWHEGKVEAALASSSSLVIEAAGLDDAAVMQPLVRRYGLDPAQPLSSKLPEKDRPRLAAAAQAMGLPPQALEPMQPWLAALTLSLAPAVKAGYDPQSGVEMSLLRMAKAGGWEVRGLETPEQQIRYLAGMSPAAQAQFLVSTLDDLDSAAAQLDAMVSAWAAGDTAGLETLFVTELKRDYPEFYDVIVVRRNAEWARTIVETLKGSGVSFVAVGAGHTVGPDSVQAQLAKLGVRAERK